MVQALFALFLKLWTIFVPQKGAKRVCISLKQNYFRRYLFTLVRLLALEGYAVSITASPLFLLSLMREPYSRKILKEHHVELCLFPPADAILLSEKSAPQFSSDYFTDKAGYHIPMTMHPNQYISDLWSETYDIEEKRNQLFFTGTFDPQTYKSPNPLFSVLIRNELLKHMKELCKSHEALSFEEVTKVRDVEFLYMNTLKAIVPYELHRKTLGGFRYMVAFPGSRMPLCHNVIEALSVGTIPLIQRSYAQHFYPPLIDGETALFFDDENDLRQSIDRALALPDEEFNRMSTKAKEYYAQHCTPSVIINTMLSEKERIFMLGAI